MSAQSTSGETVILDAERIERCIQRIARQILEDHHAPLIAITAIDSPGTVIRRIVDALEAISQTPVQGFTVTLDKEAPLDHPIAVADRHGAADASVLDGATIIVVDDVLNSGRTLLHAVATLLPHRPQYIATCVLVDRIHRRFPVQADYVGQSLSTNLDRTSTCGWWSRTRRGRPYGQAGPALQQIPDGLHAVAVQVVRVHRHVLAWL